MTGVLHTHSRGWNTIPIYTLSCPVAALTPDEKSDANSQVTIFSMAGIWPWSFEQLLRALDEQGLLSLKLKTMLPKEWGVNCKRVGKGLPALEYLSRYLYRGVISDNNILASKRGKVTFSYLNKPAKKRSEPCQEKTSCGWF